MDARSTRSTRSTLEAVRRDVCAADVAKMLLSLPERNRTVIELRYDYGGETQTFDAIGRAFRRTRERVRQLETQALRRLAPGRSARLATDRRASSRSGARAARPLRPHVPRS